MTIPLRLRRWVLRRLCRSTENRIQYYERMAQYYGRQAIEARDLLDRTLADLERERAR